MTTLRQKALVAVFAAAGLMVYRELTLPSNFVSDHHTGAVDLICKGTRTKDATGERQEVAPTTLTLEFEKGKITSWKTSLPRQSLEDVDPKALPMSSFASTYSIVCGKHPSVCIPIEDETGVTELYLFNWKPPQDNVIMGGFSNLSKDLTKLDTHSNLNGVHYSTSMTCAL